VINERKNSESRYGTVNAKRFLELVGHFTKDVANRDQDNECRLPWEDAGTKCIEML